MKKLFVLSAIALLAACGGSDNKPANDPSTNSSSTPAADETSEATPAPESTPAPSEDAPSDQPAEN